MKITTGFLAGNLFDSWTGDEVRQADTDKSARRYARMLEGGIKQCFPDAEVEVKWQEGSGSIPYDLRTHVEGVEYKEQDEVGVIVGEIGADIYQLGEWVVTPEEEEKGGK